MKPRKKRRASTGRKQPQREKHATTQRREEPINLRKEVVPDLSGFLIIRLKPGVVWDDARSLDQVAEKFSLHGIAALLKKYNLPSRPLITSVSVAEQQELEQRARERGFEPRHSLALYWRVDARGRSEAEWKELMEQFQKLQDEVDYAYLEKSASVPASAQSYAQPYLDAADIGIDARWAWMTHPPGGRGANMRFIDLEEGWWVHNDLPNSINPPIFGQNRPINLFRDHGTAVLGEIVGRDNNRGIVGIAPEASMRVVSHYNQNEDSNGHVADAIYAALRLGPIPHVLLLEVQRGEPPLPTEVDEGDFVAIQTAAGNGVIVIEAAGNGGIDLDQWHDDANRYRLRRSPAWDSYSIFAGAASSSTPHTPLNSNFGSRVDCYAWGENIATTGWTGDLTPGAPNNTKYTGTFGGTSGASAIIAGAALLVQGVYFQNTGALLWPLQMRAFLAEPAFGTPNHPTPVGVMPNLSMVIPNLPP